MTKRRLPVSILLAAILAITALAMGCASGSAKFQNKTPKFSLEYPSYYIAEPLKQDEVLRVKDPMGYPYYAVKVFPYQTGMDLNKVFNDYQKTVEADGTGFKLLSIDRVKVSGDLPGLQAELELTPPNGQKVITLFLSVIKDGKVLVITAYNQGGLKEAKRFVGTLNF